MWVTSNKDLLPDYLVEVPSRIRNMLIYRFLCATFYCICMEFGVLAVYHFSVILPMNGNPTSWPRYVIRWTFLSIYTWIWILPLLLVIGLYGILLCRMHNIRPECYHDPLDRFKHNFFHKFYLMCTTVSLSCYISCLYRSYIMRELTTSDKLMMKRANLDGYLMAFGNLCGLSYFFTQYALPSSKGFDLPIARFAMPFLGLRQISRSSLEEAVATTLIATTIFGQFLCVPARDLFYHFWRLGMAISIQLHLIRCIYGLVLQAKLPLTLHSFNPFTEIIPMHILLLKRLNRWVRTGLMLPVHFEDVKDIERSRQLPLCMVLDCAVLHGFQLQAAIEFCATINTPEMLKQLFHVNTALGCRSWRDIRNIVLGKVNDFRTELATCLSQFQPKGHESTVQPPPRPRRQMRSIIRPPPKTPCRPANPEPNDIETTEHDKYVNLIKNHWVYGKIWAFWQPFSCNYNSLQELNRILISAESLGYALRGIVMICVSSLNENDRHVVWDEDVTRIMKTLYELAVELDALEDHEIVPKSGGLCSSYRLLRLSVSQSLYHLLNEYRDYLEVLLLDDRHLFRELDQFLNNLESWPLD